MVLYIPGGAGFFCINIISQHLFLQFSDCCPKRTLGMKSNATKLIVATCAAKGVGPRKPMTKAQISQNHLGSEIWYQSMPIQTEKSGFRSKSDTHTHTHTHTHTPKKNKVSLGTNKNKLDTRRPISYARLRSCFQFVIWVSLVLDCHLQGTSWHRSVEEQIDTCGEQLCSRSTT